MARLDSNHRHPTSPRDGRPWLRRHGYRFWVRNRWLAYMAVLAVSALGWAGPVRLLLPTGAYRTLLAYGGLAWAAAVLIVAAYGLIQRRALLPLVLAEDGFGVERHRGLIERIPWEQLESVGAIRARGLIHQDGMRIVAAGREIQIYAEIDGFAELARTLKARARHVDVDLILPQ